MNIESHILLTRDVFVFVYSNALIFVYLVLVFKCFFTTSIFYFHKFYIQLFNTFVTSQRICKQWFKFSKQTVNTLGFRA